MGDKFEAVRPDDRTEAVKLALHIIELASRRELRASAAVLLLNELGIPKEVLSKHVLEEAEHGR